MGANREASYRITLFFFFGVFRKIARSRCDMG